MQEQLSTNVSGGRAAEHRHYTAIGGPGLQAPSNLLFGKLFPLQIFHNQLIFALGCHLDQLEAIVLYFILQRRGNFSLLGLGSAISFHSDQVHHTLEIRLAADRQLDGDEGSLEFLFQSLQAALEAGVVPVHLVDENQARQVLFIGIVPHEVCTHLHTRGGIEKNHRPIGHPNGPLDLSYEVQIARGIEDVDLVAIPFTR